MGATEVPVSPRVILLLVPRLSGNTQHLSAAAGQEFGSVTGRKTMHTHMMLITVYTLDQRKHFQITNSHSAVLQKVMLSALI